MLKPRFHHQFLQSNNVKRPKITHQLTATNSFDTFGRSNLASHLPERGFCQIASITSM